MISYISPQVTCILVLCIAVGLRLALEILFLDQMLKNLEKFSSAVGYLALCCVCVKTDCDQV